jgi:hypothetical protein
MRRVAIVVLALVLHGLGVPHVVRGQVADPLPRTQADVLLDEGRWSEAEDAYYAQSRERPRDPIARAALGRYIAMKGGVRPGMVLIEEARRFGLNPATSVALLAPWRSVLNWRGDATLPADSVVRVHIASSGEGLFRFPLPRGRKGDPGAQGIAGDTVWADVVPRMVGIESVFGKKPMLGIEVLERLVPSYDVAARRLTLSADPRSALRAKGRRYSVLRTPHEVKVLLGTGRVLPLVDALRELAPSWWQLDLLHGFVVVR